MKADILREKIRKLRRELRKEEQKQGKWMLVFKYPLSIFLMICTNIWLGFSIYFSYLEWLDIGVKEMTLIKVILLTSVYLIFNGVWMLANLSITRLKLK